MESSKWGLQWIPTEFLWFVYFLKGLIEALCDLLKKSEHFCDFYAFNSSDSFRGT